MSGARNTNPFHSRSAQAESTTPQEEILLLHVALGVLVGVLGTAGVLWVQGTAWLAQHHILVAADQRPLVAIAGADGVGLDLPRLTIAAAVAVAAVAAGLSWLRHQILLRRRPDDAP